MISLPALFGAAVVVGASVVVGGSVVVGSVKLENTLNAKSPLTKYITFS